MTSRLPLILGMLLSLLLPGCQSVQFKDRQSSLEDSLRAYDSTIRWGNIADAYAFLTPELAKQTPVPDGLENIRVTQYWQQGSPEMGDNTASINVGIRYIHQDRQVERTLSDKQQWRFLEGVGWRRSNPIPEFR
jgi:hypothetical protein